MHINICFHFNFFFDLNYIQIKLIINLKKLAFFSIINIQTRSQLEQSKNVCNIVLIKFPFLLHINQFPNR